MDDLGRGLAPGTDVIMMGGGNPALISPAEAVWRRRFEEILASPGQMERMLGIYDTPQGKSEFLETLAAFFADRYGWPVTAENIGICNGSQTAYFLLFNLLAGPSGGQMRRVLFPLVPEYIGYADQGLFADQFAARRPRVELLAGNRFKYHIHFEGLELDNTVAAVCLSRPTNPSANLVTDAEIHRLAEVTAERGIPLLIDSAYGAPFPHVTFQPVEPYWADHVVASFSLSKLGLPTTRTGIVVACKDLIRRLARMNAIVGLANSGIGQCITEPLFATGEIVDLCRQHIQPFYYERSRKVMDWIDAAFAAAGVPYRLHVCEGAFFLWLWLPELPITDRQYYARLKSRGVLVVPGSYFFPGLAEDWDHRHQCIRLSYGQDLDRIRRGVEILAEEARRAMEEA